MKLADVLGQPHAVTCLERALAAGKVGQAYFFYGPEGVGKTRAALAFAQAVNCERPVGPGVPCEQCGPCHEIVKEIFPEVRVVGPEEDTGRDRSFHKETLAEAMTWAARTTPAGRTKVCVLEDVHLMSQEAANQFLKMLEEPPPRTAWILLSSEPGAVLTTIRSRCQPVRFTLLPTPVVTEILTSRGVAEPVKDAALCMGRLHEDLETLRSRADEAAGMVAAAEKFDLAALVETAQGYGRKEEKEKLGGLLDALERELAIRLRNRPAEADRLIEAMDAVGRARWRLRKYIDKTMMDALGAELALALTGRLEATGG